MGQPGRERWDTISFGYRPDADEIEIAINGVALAERARRAELPDARAGGQPALAGTYRASPPARSNAGRITSSATRSSHGSMTATRFCSAASAASGAAGR